MSLLELETTAWTLSVLPESLGATKRTHLCEPAEVNVDAVPHTSVASL